MKYKLGKEIENLPEPPLIHNLLTQKNIYHEFKKFVFAFSIIENKTGDFKKFMSILIFIGTIFFLTYGILPGQEQVLVLAADENFQCDYPASCAYSGDCDTYGDPSDGECTNDNCDDNGGTWTADGGQDNCCGDDAAEEYCSGGYTACYNANYYSNGDNNSYTCECGVSGTQSTCDDGETGCWDNSVSDCCGDDGGSDDWCDGSSAACVDGTYRTDGDSYQYICETCGSNTWVSTGTGTNSDCCGDDGATEDFESSSGAGNSACYNGNSRADGWSSGAMLISNGLMYDCGGSLSDDSDLSTHISNGNCTSREGLYCQIGSNTWSSSIPTDCGGCSNGDDCSGSDLCIEGTCRSVCNSSYDGDRCSDDSNDYSAASSGICARDNGGFWDCNKTEVANYSNDYWQDCYEVEGGAPTDSISCDTDVAPSYFANGICTYTSGTIDSNSVSCDADEACFDDTNYRADCSNCYSSGSDWDSCDSDGGTSYTANGICVSAGACDSSGEACYDGSSYQDGCSSCSDNDACDSSIIDGSYSRDGYCCDAVAVGTCTIDGSRGFGESCCVNSNCGDGLSCSGGTCTGEQFEDITINNLGETGFEEINEDYTSLRTVVLHLNYSSFAEKCRYINYDDPTTQPLNNSQSWTEWESCVEVKFWQLTTGDGNKTVYYQINYSYGTGLGEMKNDSIYYNSSGAGLDTTPPGGVEFDFGGYTNDNTTVSISWNAAYDPESELLQIPLLYNLSVLQNGIDIYDKFGTETSFIKNDFNFSHGDNITINITVINSAGLTNSTLSKKLSIDLEDPSEATISLTQFKNQTNNQWQDIDENVWINAKLTRFEWIGTDNLSGVGAYSYVLNLNSFIDPNNVPEGIVGSFANEINTTLSVNSGLNYFRVKVRDVAGNWGPIDSNGEFSFKIDNTPPSKPDITDQYFDTDDQSITYTWRESEDVSGIDIYRINVTDQYGSLLQSFDVPSTETTAKFNNTISEELIAIVGARNGAGLWRWSNQEDIELDSEPPKILSSSEGIIIESPFLLFVYTNELTDCSYTVLGETSRFLYTNTTYHESKVKLPNGDYSFSVHCEDLVGNTNSTVFAVNVDTGSTIVNVDIEPSLITYDDIITSIYVNVSNTTSDLGGISKESFYVTLDGESVEFVMHELGNGQYLVGIEDLDEGSYETIITINGVNSNSMTMNVEDLNFNIYYEDSNLGSISDTLRMSYGNLKGISAGFATSSEEYYGFSSGNTLNMTVGYNDNAHIFFTGELKDVNARTKMLFEDRFLSKLNPSFGYKIEDNYILTLILDYFDIDITTDTYKEIKGRENILIRNEKSTSGKKTVYMSSDEND